jgi:hypothetical protein
MFNIILVHESSFDPAVFFLFQELEMAWGGPADIYAASVAVGSAVRDPTASASALCPGAASRSTSHVSHMTMFSNSPSGVDSSLHYHTSHLNSPGISGLSRLNSPQLSRLAIHRYFQLSF